MKGDRKFSAGFVLFFTAVFLAVSGLLYAAEPVNEKESANNENDKTYDPDAPPSTPTKIAPYTFFGGYVEFEFEDEREFDLDSSESDSLSILESIASVATAYKPEDNFEAYFNLLYSLQTEFEEEGDNDKYRPDKLKISQAYLSFKEIFENTDLIVGRQRFDDDREWLFDRKLNAVRIFHDLGNIELDGSISWEGIFDTDLLNSGKERRVDNYYFRAEYSPVKKVKIAPYLFYRDDRSREWSRPLFVGIHSSGEVSKSMDYWAEFAWVSGREKQISKDSSKTFSFEGFGFDVGTVYEFDAAMEPCIVAGFAFGSGKKNSPAGEDRGFRQTGLHDNSDKLTGITSVDYYGELFEPELSNIVIFTLGGGIKPQKNLSCEVIYHYYLQHYAADTIRDSSIDADPTGLSRDLGSEIDFILGYRHSKKLDIKGAFGVFMPGDAFPDDSDDTAYVAKIKIRYKF